MPRCTKVFLGLLLLLVMAFNLSAKEKPVITSVAYQPQGFNVSSGITVSPMTDNDQQEYHYKYRWFVNGDPTLFEFAEHLPGEYFQRGDEIAVEVIPFDSAGNELLSFKSLPVVVENAPPQILSSPPQQLIGMLYEYTLDVTDPDDDSCQCLLEEAPVGMAIVPPCQVVWPLQGVAAGKYSARVVVDDGFTGRISQTITMNISMSQQERAAHE